MCRYSQRADRFIGGITMNNLFLIFNVMVEWFLMILPFIIITGLLTLTPIIPTNTKKRVNLLTLGLALLND